MKVQLLWSDKQNDKKQLGKNRGILKPSWAFMETTVNDFLYLPFYFPLYYHGWGLHHHPHPLMITVFMITVLMMIIIRNGNWSEQSLCAVLVHCRQNKVATIFGIIFSPSGIYFSPRKGCSKVLKYCMGSEKY